VKTGYLVSDCMTIHPITIPGDTSLLDCARLMRDKHIGSVIVLDSGRLVGIITEQELVRRALAEGLDIKTTAVQSIMTLKEDMAITKPGNDIYDAIVVMRDYNTRHLPVLDREKLVGFLTLKDVLKIQPQLFELISEKYNLREESRKPVYDDSEGVCSECGSLNDQLMDVDGSLVCPSCRGEEE
jgi:CBS domain-containing protein